MNPIPKRAGHVRASVEREPRKTTLHLRDERGRMVRLSMRPKYAVAIGLLLSAPYSERATDPEFLFPGEIEHDET